MSVGRIASARDAQALPAGEATYCHMLAGATSQPLAITTRSSRTRKLIETGDVLIAAGVLLETEWVLRAAYGFDADAIRTAFQGLMDLPTVHVESPERVAMALGWYAAGLDFAGVPSRIEQSGKTVRDVRPEVAEAG